MPFCDMTHEIYDTCKMKKDPSWINRIKQIGLKRRTKNSQIFDKIRDTYHSTGNAVQRQMHDTTAFLMFSMGRARVH